VWRPLDLSYLNSEIPDIPIPILLLIGSHGAASDDSTCCSSFGWLTGSLWYLDWSWRIDSSWSTDPAASALRLYIGPPGTVISLLRTARWMSPLQVQSSWFVVCLTHLSLTRSFKLEFSPLPPCLCFSRCKWHACVDGRESRAIRQWFLRRSNWSLRYLRGALLDLFHELRGKHFTGGFCGCSALACSHNAIINHMKFREQPKSVKIYGHPVG